MSGSLVTILDVEVSRIAYKGETVTTFTQVDRVHERPDGTARRTFNDNRSRFIDKEDFIVLDQPDAIRSLGLTRPQGGTADRVILLTKRGYLKLTKPMSDDRAWAVQGEMVDRYFAIEKVRKALAPSPAKAATDAIRLFMAAKRAARSIGYDNNQAALSANRITVNATGVDPLDLLGATHLIAPQQERILTPTQIGAELGRESAKSVNLLLQRRGFQTGPDWTPTDKGRPYAVWLDTGKRQGSGTPVRQLKWSADIVPVLKSEIAAKEEV